MAGCWQGCLDVRGVASWHGSEARVPRADRGGERWNAERLAEGGRGGPLEAVGLEARSGDAVCARDRRVSDLCWGKFRARCGLFSSGWLV